jgi:FdhE protein
VTAGGGASGDVVPLRLPDPERLFAGRAARLRALAAGHALGDWLLFLARVAEGQRRAAARLRPPLPAEPPAAHPLDPARAPPGPAWREALAIVLGLLRDAPMPAPARAAVERLAAAPAGALDALAARVLAGRPAREELADAPLVAAALQAHHAALAARLDPGLLERSLATCPACNSPPVAGLVQGDGLRYLACGLCGCEWHLTRLQCACCLGAEGLQHLVAQGEALQHLAVDGDDGVKAEACPSCRAYVKLFYRERRPDAEPLADDLATLSLDLLLADDGWRRYGPNLLLATADGDA